MFSFAMKNYASLDEIEHCFLEMGHTQNENDSVHSVIAQTAKKIPVYTPEKWATVVREQDGIRDLMQSKICHQVTFFTSKKCQKD